jgi:hypothetical protein
LATGLVQAPWVLAEVRQRCPDAVLHLEWEAFVRADAGLLVWEAFVTGDSKGASHIEDARLGAQAFARALPDPRTVSKITAERPLSLAGAAALWSGWLDDVSALRTPRHS